MSETAHVGDIVGRIRRRLLVNQWVDPDEVLAHLPDGVRPHVGSNGGVVVGCCMIEIESARPSPLPSKVGISIRAAAHRISVEVGAADSPTLAVWVPVRHTDSRVAVLTGGRVFPGVHAAADVNVQSDARLLSWTLACAAHPAGDFDMNARARTDRTSGEPSEVADIVIGTALGLSPGRRSGEIEAVEMHPLDNRSCTIEVEHLASDFMSSFHSAAPAESLLMTDVDVIWHPADSPVTEAA